MSLKAQLKRHVMRHMFSPKRLGGLRYKAELKRQAAGEPHVVEYFHEAGDPYSHLMVQLLPEFCEKFDIELRTHIVPPPEDWAAPERSKLDAYARKDALLLAKRIGLEFSDPGITPTSQEIQAANLKLADVAGKKSFLGDAKEIGEMLWSGHLKNGTGGDPKAVAEQLEKGASRRETLGHYLGGTLYYAGEWYWGPDSQVMKQSQGKANPQAVNELLRSKLGL